MKEHLAPQEYCTGSYLEYQKKYAQDIRESDKVLLKLVGDILASDFAEKQGPVLMDMGCSNGNLLLHLKRAFPQLEYQGSDVFPEIIDCCNNNPDV